MTAVRPSAVAGRFYPDNPRVLRSTVAEFLAAAPSFHVRPKAIIAPHAGYVYSGPVAGTVYAQFAGCRDTIRRVVLLGPSHFVAVDGIAASSADAFETPLGRIPVDRAAIEQLLKFPQVQVLDAAHAREHSLEVQLPFLQEALGEFNVVPLVVGRATPEQVAEVIEDLWGGPETLFVISSDLSHYHSYISAGRLDRETSRCIEDLRIDQLAGERCCGYLPIGGLLTAARRHGLQVKTIDLRNSGDTAGPRDRVVGYGGYVLAEDLPFVSILDRAGPPISADDDPPLDEAGQALLFDVAFRSIERGLAYGSALEIDPATFPAALQQRRAAFVTLKIKGKLRGCMGSLQATEPLVSNVSRNAFSAAFLDPRFSPLTYEEFDHVEVSLSVLTSPQPLDFDSEADLLAKIRPGVDGLILLEGNRRGTLLPAVWEHVADAREFLQALKKKAGLPENYWSETVRVLRYGAQSYGLREGE